LNAIVPDQVPATVTPVGAAGGADVELLHVTPARTMSTA